MASTSSLWWTTPLQSLAVAASATVFGGSAPLSLVLMPMLEERSIPAQYQARQLLVFLKNAEKVFPPINSLSTVSNLVLTITAYLRRNDTLGSGAAIGGKLGLLGTAFAFNFATTLYSLVFMVPRNNKLRSSAQSLEKDPDDSKSLAEFREAMASWKVFSYGRAALMLGATIAGLCALSANERVLRL